MDFIEKWFLTKEEKYLRLHALFSGQNLGFKFMKHFLPQNFVGMVNKIFIKKNAQTNSGSGEGDVIRQF